MSLRNEVFLTFRIDKGSKIRISKINIEGNEAIADKKLRGKMKDIKEYRWWRIWKSSRYLDDKYKEDKQNIISKYNDEGYRDARIVWDTTYIITKEKRNFFTRKKKEKKSLVIDMKGHHGTIIGMDGNDVWTRTNKIINECDNTPDRVCWEMSNQQIFHTSDKQIISDSIMQFLKQNDTYDVSEEDNVSVLKREHIIERFTEIANDILSIDENEFPYFVFKNTTVDDGVERWFEKYDERIREIMGVTGEQDKEVKNETN